MAGHSKWANIKHRKAAQDAKRGKIFTKLIREITTSARLGDADPANNPRLRAAVAAALTGNMTRDTINRAIQRGAGGGDGEQLETIVYEGYGPAGSAVMVECLTDNRNRTVAEVRHAFSKCGGNLGTDGSVAYLFSKKGLLTFVKETLGDQVKEVKLSSELGSHPVCMTPAEGMSFEMEKYMKRANPEFAFPVGRVLELNPEHEAVQAMQKAMTEDPEKAKDYAKLLCYQAQLMAELPLDDPYAYTELVCRLMK